MSENGVDRAGGPYATNATAESLAVEPVAANERPTYLCEFCGPDKPAEQVYRCTLCELNYCVKHLAPMAHYCFGALGKSQTIGVSGST